jgi:hypothetical protein
MAPTQENTSLDHAGKKIFRINQGQKLAAMRLKEKMAVVREEAKRHEAETFRLREEKREQMQALEKERRTIIAKNYARSQSPGGRNRDGRDNGRSSRNSSPARASQPSASPMNTGWRSESTSSPIRPSIRTSSPQREQLSSRIDKGDGVLERLRQQLADSRNPSASPKQRPSSPSKSPYSPSRTSRTIDPVANHSMKWRGASPRGRSPRSPQSSAAAAAAAAASPAQNEAAAAESNLPRYMQLTSVQREHVEFAQVESALRQEKDAAWEGIQKSRVSPTASPASSSATPRTPEAIARNNRVKERQEKALVRSVERRRTGLYTSPLSQRGGSHSGTNEPVPVAAPSPISFAHSPLSAPPVSLSLKPHAAATKIQAIFRGHAARRGWQENGAARSSANAAAVQPRLHGASATSPLRPYHQAAGVATGHGAPKSPNSRYTRMAALYRVDGKTSDRVFPSAQP